MLALPFAGMLAFRRDCDATQTVSARKAQKQQAHMKRCRFISASAREGDELEDDAVSLGSHDSDDEEHGEEQETEEDRRFVVSDQQEGQNGSWLELAALVHAQARADEDAETQALLDRYEAMEEEDLEQEAPADRRLLRQPLPPSLRAGVQELAEEPPRSLPQPPPSPPQPDVYMERRNAALQALYEMEREGDADALRGQQEQQPAPAAATAPAPAPASAQPGEKPTTTTVVGEKPRYRIKRKRTTPPGAAQR